MNTNGMKLGNLRWTGGRRRLRSHDGADGNVAHDWQDGWAPVCRIWVHRAHGYQCLYRRCLWCAFRWIYPKRRRRAQPWSRLWRSLVAAGAINLHASFHGNGPRCQLECRRGSADASQFYRPPHLWCHLRCELRPAFAAVSQLRLRSTQKSPLPKGTPNSARENGMGPLGRATGGTPASSSHAVSPVLTLGLGNPAFEDIDQILRVEIAAGQNADDFSTSGSAG